MHSSGASAAQFASIQQTLTFMNFKEELQLAYDVLKELICSPVNLYTKDPDLYDKVQLTIDTIENAFSENTHHE